MPHTQGRCHACNVALRWPSSPRLKLKDAYCPQCGGKLEQTTHLFKGVWLSLYPLPRAVARQKFPREVPQ